MGILSGIKKYKKYKQVSETDHQLVSYWTSTDTVETNDGKDLSTFLDSVVLIDDDGEETDIPIVENNNLDNDIVEFISHDSDGEELQSDFSIMTLISGSKLSNLMERLTCTINNVKYLINILGTNDITSGLSKLGDGTVTGAVRSLNNATIYSEKETPCGIYVGGQTIYRKVINCGAAPNTTEKLIPHGIEGFIMAVNIRGMLYNISDTRVSFPLNLTVAAANMNQYQIRIHCDGQYIHVLTGTNYSTGYVIVCVIEYLKEESPTLVEDDNPPQLNS